MKKQKKSKLTKKVNIDADLWPYLEEMAEIEGVSVSRLANDLLERSTTMVRAFSKKRGI